VRVASSAANRANVFDHHGSFRIEVPVGTGPDGRPARRARAGERVITGAGMTLYQVLRELQIVLALILGARCAASR
jgi:hypothetical protein